MNPWNAGRLAAAMQAKGLDALVATTPENFHYATGYWSVGSQILRSALAMAIVDRRGMVQALVLSCGDVASFVTAGFDPERIFTYGRFYFAGGDEARPIQARTEQAAASAHEALARALAACGLGQGRVGLDEGQLPPPVWDALPTVTPGAHFEPAASVFREARLVKSPYEVACLRRATEIAEDALLDALRLARPGITEMELARVFETGVAQRGGRPVFTVVTFGERAALADTPPSARALAPGDVMRFDIGVRYQGYCSDIARTAVLGRPSPKL
ncbi:MAG TPA: M24 family metallopeptidase, partial [Bacillota bacterium]